MGFCESIHSVPYGTQARLVDLTQHFMLGYYHAVPPGPRVRGLVSLAVEPDQVGCGFWPLGKLELESRVEETAGNYATAFQDQLGFCAEEERGNLD